MLCQRHISAVQSLALVALNHLDLIEKADASRDALKRSLVANGNFDHQLLFPDYFPPKVDKHSPEAELPTDAPLDFTDVEWKTGADAIGEYERMMAALRGAQTGQMSGDQMADTGDMWTEWR